MANILGLPEDAAGFHVPPDPMGYLKSVRYSLDPVQIGTEFSAGIYAARTNPFSGLDSVIKTSSAVHDLIGPRSTIFGERATIAYEPISALSSLSTMKSPLEGLSGLSIADPFRSTICSLSSVASVASSLQTVLNPDSMASFRVAPTTERLSFNLGVSDGLLSTSAIASPYLASAASVFSLESKFSFLTDPSAGRTTLVSESILPGILWKNIDYLQNSVLSVSQAAQTTWDVLGLSSDILKSTPINLLRSPAIELYTSAHAVAAITLQPSSLPEIDEEIEEIIEESVGEFEARLAKLDRELVSTYKGALAAMNSGHDDWQRHSMVSFRELCTHVLHMLTPDKEILPRLQPTDLHDGRPTRRARLNYIFARISGKEIAGFYEADMKAAIELFELLNSGTHKLGNKASRDQFHYLRGRIVGLVEAMLLAAGF